MNKIYIISPHIDDAIFSLGGKILEWGRDNDVIIINIFSETNFVFDGEIKKEDAMTIRKREDTAVKSLLGNVNFVYLDFPEALLRGIPRESLFIEKPDFFQEQDMGFEIKKTLESIIPNEAIVYAPSGFGMHIDHLFTRNIMTGIQRSIIYYADLPYFGRSIRQDSANSFLEEKQNSNDHPDKIIIDNHIMLCSKYKSQILERHLVEITNILKKHGYIFWH